MSTSVSISMSMSYLNGPLRLVSCHSFLLTAVPQRVTIWPKELYWIYSQMRKLRFIEGSRRTDQYVRAPHGTACGGLGWVRNRSPLCWLEPPSSPTNYHQYRSTSTTGQGLGKSRRGCWGGGCRGGLLKQGQAVAISGWYSSCCPVIHTHSNPRLIIECRAGITFNLLYLHPNIRWTAIYICINTITFNLLYLLHSNMTWPTISASTQNRYEFLYLYFTDLFVNFPCTIQRAKKPVSASTLLNGKFLRVWLGMFLRGWYILAV